MIRLLRYLKKRDILYIAFCAALVVLQVYCDLTMPDYTSKLTQEVAAGMPTMNSVWKNGGLMLAYALGSMASAMLCGYFAAATAANFAKTLRKVMFERVTSFSAAEINRFGVPSLITRTTNDVVQMQTFIAIGLQMMIKAPVLAIWAICKVSASAVEWTIATAVVVCVIAVTVGILVGVCYPKFRQIQKLTDGLNNAMRESITGVRVVRAFNAEDYQTAKFEQVNEKVKRNQLFTARGMGLMMPIMQMCMNGLTLAVYWIGAALINKEANVPARVVLLGDMAAFTQYAMQVVMAFMMLIMVFMILPRCIVSARRIYEVLNTHRSVRSGAVTEVNADGDTPVVEFKNVAFAYDHGESKAVSDISFTVGRGQTVAFIGATGSGKTTLVNLIERFYDADEGEVLFDGVNVKQYDEEVLRGRISLAPQRAVLFKGDIKSNVVYGSDGGKNGKTDDGGAEVDSARLDEALDVACAAEFVGGLDEGVDAPVAQDGSNFSGGQKQRLSIARAVYKRGELMIFDDTFSALDYKTDFLVRKKLKEKLGDATVLIIAQRIGTIMNADKIIVLDEGKIVGCGTHKELLESCDIYKEIASSQLSKEEL